MDVLIYGAGAVGLGLGSFLLQAGAAVRFVTRPAIARALAERGLERTGIFGEHRCEPSELEARTSLAALGSGPAPDFVLVTTKSFDSEAAARDLAARVECSGEASRIVLCQNGWGNAEVFTGHFPKTRIWNARVITGFRFADAHRIEVTAHAEPVRAGSLFGGDAREMAPLCAALARGGLPAEPTDRIAEDLWAKLLYNGCLNAVGAIFRVPYGDLGESPHSRAILRELAREIFAVMEAAGYATRWGSPEAFLRDLYDVLLPPTAGHESSTLQDLRAGKRTEIDALNGAVVKLGEALGIPVPANRTVCEMIRFLEAAGDAIPGE